MNYDARIDVPEEREGAVSFDPLADISDEERQSRRRMWLIGAIALAVLIAVWFMVRQHNATDDADKTNQAPTVSVAAPGRATIAGTITGTGTLAAKRELPVGVAGEGGQVAEVLVEPGQWVRAGQVLATIDRSVQVQQQAGSAAQIQVAEADLRLAQANYDRALQLVERGFISKADIDRLRATRDSAAARVRLAGAQLGEQQARTRRLSIVAPAAGLVLERKVEPGQVVGSGSGVLFRLAKDGEMELKAMIGEVDFNKLSVGGGAKVTPVGSTKTFNGQIWQLSPVIDPNTRQGTARIAMGYAPELRPGGFATAVISSGAVVAPQLPDSALLSDSKGSYVYIIDKNNKAQRRDVVTGLVSDSGIAIASGLDGSERVVLRSGGFLLPGESVNPVLAKP
jgi:HlyD family secretion protein